MLDQVLSCCHKSWFWNGHALFCILCFPSIIGSVLIYSDASLPTHTHVDIFIPSLSLGCWRDVQSILLWLILCTRHFFQQGGLGSSVISTALGRPRSSRNNLLILSVTPFAAFLMSATWLIGIRIIAIKLNLPVYKHQRVDVTFRNDFTYDRRCILFTARIWTTGHRW